MQRDDDQAQRVAKKTRVTKIKEWESKLLFLNGPPLKKQCMQEICGENLRKITNGEAVNDEHTI